MSDHYNEAPEGLKEISTEQWRHGMFMYVIDKSTQRQVRRGETFDLLLFPLSYAQAKEKKLGYAIKHEWFDNESGRILPNEKQKMVFCRYGKDEDWTEFQNKFAAQFAGDNS